MRGKPKKAAMKGGAKRHISHIKRTNQKRNKLVKQGKAKPLNSTPRYIPNQARKAQQENTITPWQPSEQEVKGQSAPFVQPLTQNVFTKVLFCLDWRIWYRTVFCLLFPNPKLWWRLS